MQGVEKQSEGMSLEVRALEFARITGATKITDGYQESLPTELAINKILEILKELRTNEGTLYILGNGGSSSVASHSVTDFLNVAKLRAITIHDQALLTCMANDYGYENAYARIISTLARPSDVLIAISSSGRSRNITNAAAAMRDQGGATITLSGFAADNPLRVMGDFNVWLDSSDYGFVEIGHQFVLHNLADRLRLGL